VLEYAKNLPFLLSTMDLAIAFEENLMAINDVVAADKMPKIVAKKLCKYVS